MELKPEDHPDIDGMIEAINRQNIHEIAGKFGNVLELVTAGKYPVIGEIEQVMKAEGACQCHDERKRSNGHLACLPTGIQPWLHTRQCVNQILQNRFT